MADSKDLRGGPDHLRVDLHEAEKLRCWTGTFGRGREPFVPAVPAASRRADAVERHLAAPA